MNKIVININISAGGPGSQSPAVTQRDIDYAVNVLKLFIMAKVSGLNTSLTEIKANLTEGTDEILAKITKLEEQLGNMDQDIPEDATATLEEIKSMASRLASVVPNAPPVDPTLPESQT